MVDGWLVGWSSQLVGIHWGVEIKQRKQPCQSNWRNKYLSNWRLMKKQRKLRTNANLDCDKGESALGKKSLVSYLIFFLLLLHHFLNDLLMFFFSSRWHYADDATVYFMNNYLFFDNLSSRQKKFICVSVSVKWLFLSFFHFILADFRRYYHIIIIKQQ